jgi:ABC-type transport system involved in multi-copper enzyme maturation permease subunit
MAIHEQNYVRYDGPLRDSGAWRVIAWTGFRTHLSFLRTKLLILGLWLGPLLFAGLIFLEYTLRGQMGQMMGEPMAPKAAYVSGFLQMQVFSLAILLMASGCGVISEDLKYRTFQLYFSKPITRTDYAVGKFLSIALLGSLVTVLPAFLLAGLRAALFIQSEFFKPVLEQMGIGVGLSALFTLIICAMVAGLSSLTSRTGYVVLSWIGVLLVPLILSGIVAIATGGNTELASLWSLTGNMLVVADMALGVDKEAVDAPLWVAPIVLTVVSAAGIGALVRRINRLEGVA